VASNFKLPRLRRTFDLRLLSTFDLRRTGFIDIHIYLDTTIQYAIHHQQYFKLCFTLKQPSRTLYVVLILPEKFSQDIKGERVFDHLVRLLRLQIVNRGSNKTAGKSEKRRFEQHGL
jgi:hypothetical protein